MTSLSYDTVILKYQEEITTLLNECVYKGYNALSSYLSAPLAVCLVLYIACIGFSIMNGWLRLSMAEFIKAALKIGLIYTFAMNWGNFSKVVVDGFQSLSNEISGVLLAATPVELPHFAGEGITGSLQSMLIEISKVGNYLFQKGGITKLAPLFDGCFVWVSGGLMLAIAFLEIVMAQIMMATLLVAGPLFISFTLFAPTKVFFERWVGALFGCVFIIILVNITIAINMAVLQSIIADEYLTKAINFSLVSFIPFYIVSVLAIFQLLRVSSLAMSIGGGIGVSSVTQQASAALGVGVASGFRTMSSGFSAVKQPISKVASSFGRSPLSADPDKSKANSSRNSYSGSGSNKATTDSNSKKNTPSAIPMVIAAEDKK